MSEFGASLKRARESLGISLDNIATETRISIRFLQAIEDEDFQQLPGGIFNRGFIRTYASRVGLDPEQAVADYERLYQATEPEPILRVIDPEPRRPQRNIFPVAVVGLVLLIAIFYFGTKFSNTTSVPEAPPVVEAKAPPVPAPVVPAVPAPVPDVVEPAPETAPVAPATPASPSAEPVLTLQLEVHETTWVKLTADGATVGQEILQPGTTRSYKAQASMDLTIGNAGGITVKLNGREVRNLGTSGQVRVLNITPENIAKITG